jgi:hypothetical protein
MDSEDPAVQEFLAREQAELADLQDDQGAGAGDFAAFQAPAEDPNIDFPNEFDSIQNAPVPQAAPVTNGFMDHQPKPATPINVPRVEPEKIKRWREEQKVRLEKKDADEEKEKKKLLEQGKKELEDWYKNRTEQLEKTKKQNRVAELELVKERDADQPGLEWERIARLCEFNPKAGKNSKDITRFRSILLQLKQSPIVKAQSS